MGDGSSDSRSTSGNLGAPASPLRIFTRVNNNDIPEDRSPGPREAAHALLGNAFSRPLDDESDHGSRPSSSHKAAAGKGSRAVAPPRAGRHGGGHYHPLPSHWRGQDSSPSSVGSPVTPDSGGSEDPGAPRILPLVSSAGSQVACTPEPFRPYHNSHSYNTVKSRGGRDQSPASSFYAQVGSMGDAFGSVSSLEWPNDRPGSTHSYRSTDQTGNLHASDAHAESPVDSPGHNGRLVPALGALAARSGAAQRSALGVHTGPSRHHPSASTSSSHYSYGMNSPPVRGMSAFGSFKDPSSPLPEATLAVSASAADGEAPVSGQSEDIVRKYFGLQRQPPQQPASQQSPQPALSPLGKSSSESSGGDEASGNIVYRRAVSSGDLPTLEELHGAMQGHAGHAEFLTHDLVESPLEALVRRLTIELFQLYVSEDRKKSNGPHQQQQQQQMQLSTNDEDDIAQSLSRVLDPLSTDEGYVQQFRLGPSLRSGSTTPAVTMDGYFMPQAASGAAEPGSSDVRPRPRPRHRQLERTWMEEALIKARRVSTIDENAEETILQGLDSAALPAGSEPSLLSMANTVVDSFKDFPQDSSADGAQFSSSASGPPRVAKRGQALQLGMPGAEVRGTGQRQASGDRIRPRPKLGLSNLGEEGSETSADDGTGRTMSPRSHYRARDPAAPHRKLPAERRHKNVAAASISPARASLLRAVGRRQSIRLQPGKGQIVVAETMSDSRSPAMAGDRSSIVAPVTLDPDVVARAKRTNSLPGIMNLPETKEVSYRDIQRKAARKAELKKAPKSRGRYARRAERMVRGGTQPSSARSGDGQSQGGRRRHGHHRRMGSRADMEQQLVRVELPPPVPLRVRREQVRIVPEPLIIVRPPVAQVLPDDVSTTEQKIQRVHNQLLGAQAVLSRHISVMRQTASKGSANKSSGSKGSAAAASTTDAAVMAVQLPGKNTVRNLALDAMMLEGAFDEDDDVHQQKKSHKHKHHERKENPHHAAGSSNAVPAWRSARRRSTLRRKERAQQQQQQQRGTDKPAPTSSTAVTSRQPMPMVRRLLLHGPAYKIYSSLRARPDAYLFLFTDILVVAVRAGGDSGTLSAPMTGPSTDASMIPTSCRFRVQLVIPLVHRITTMRAQREGASKRAGEDDDAEEKRITSQEDRIRRACHIFEKNTSEAVVYLINHEIIGPNADMVAGFLHRCTALSRRQTGSFLGAGIMGENLHENPTPDEVEQEKIFHQQTWISYLDRCNIVGVPVDEALRSILFYFRLPQNRRSTGILLEIAALQWFTKNKEFGTVSGVYIPESQDVAVKLVFTIMMLNSEVHNPMIRSEAQSDAVYHAFLQKFKASVVDDPALAGKRKGNVLRKRDQPRVVTVMEVPTDVLKAIYERVLANRLVTCSDTYAVAPEFDVDWVRDPTDVNAPVLTDEEVENEIEDIYCDPGFRDGILFNATSDRLPAKLNIEPAAWVRVTVRIPEADPKFALVVRVLGATVDTSSSGTNSSSDPVCILPSPRLTFQAANTASFVIRPQQVGHFTLHFVPEGTRARYYHPIPPRSILVEGGFMRQAVQVSWKRSDGHHGRHMFGLDSLAAKNMWVQHLDSVLKTAADVKEILHGAEKAAQALIPTDPSGKGASNGKTDPSSTVARGASDHSVSFAQMMSALGI